MIVLMLIMRRLKVVLMKTMMMMMMMDLCRPTSTLGQAGINTGATEEPLLTGSSQIFDINVILAFQIFEPLWDLNFDFFQLPQLCRLLASLGHGLEGDLKGH